MDYICYIRAQKISVTSWYGLHISCIWHIQTYYRVHTKHDDIICYIQLHTVTYILHTDYIRITYKLHINYIWNTYRLHKEHIIHITYRQFAYDNICITYELYTVYIQFTYKLHTGYMLNIHNIQITYHLHTDYIPLTYRLHTNDIQMT